MATVMLKKVLIRNDKVEKRSYSPMRRSTALQLRRNNARRDDQPGDHQRDLWGIRGSQAKHEPMSRHDKKGKLSTGRCEGEELKPQVKQAGRMDCPSPNRVASARTCFKTDQRKWSGRSNLQGKTGQTVCQSEDKKTEGDHVTYFPHRKRCSKGRGILWFSAFTENRSNRNRQKLWQGE